jgi:hypothetical protein
MNHNLKNKIMKWIKASELKEINYPTCVKIDGGGAPFYTTVCSIGELLNLTSEYNPIDEIEVLDESNQEQGNDAIEFAEWISGEGYVQYDDKNRWIAPQNNNNVYPTEKLYQKFKSESQPQEVNEESEKELEERTDRNMNLISSFMEHLETEGIIIPESAMLSFFNA